MLTTKLPKDMKKIILSNSPLYLPDLGFPPMLLFGIRCYIVTEFRRKIRSLLRIFVRH